MRIMSVFGSEVLAGYSIAIRVILFSLIPAWGMSSAAATLVGQNLGANKSGRAKQSVWNTSTYCAFFMGMVSIIYLVFTPQIIELFNTTDAVTSSGSLSLRIMTAPFVFNGFGMIVLNAFNGAGDTKNTDVHKFCVLLVNTITFCISCGYNFKLWPGSVFSAIAVGEVLMTIIAVIWFKKGLWKK